MNAVIFGAGTYGQVYFHYLRNAGVNVVGFLDDDESKHETEIFGIPILGGRAALNELPSGNVTDVYCPIGNNSARLRVNRHARSLGLKTPNFIHQSAIVDSLIPQDSGIYILPGVVIMPFVELQQDIMISMNAKIAHHTKLDDGVFLSTGVSVGASMRLRERVYAGMSSTLVTGKCKNVGAGAIIGAGAVVISDIPDETIYAGIPAKFIRYINK